MELKLEDYARRIDRFYYEIMREYADDAPTTKDLEIFIRPSSGYLDVWRFVLQDDGIKLGFDFKHSLKGEDCFVSRDVWHNLAKNPDPPWLFPKTSIDVVDRLHLVPSFIDLKYLPKNETESYKFGILESVKIYLSNIWIRKKEENPNYVGKSINKTKKNHDELDELIIKIADSLKERSIDSIKNEIKRELRKLKLQSRKYDKEGILLQWKDDKRLTFIWKHKNAEGKIYEKTCSHGTLKNRISKLAKIGVIS